MSIVKVRGFFPNILPFLMAFFHLFVGAPLEAFYARFVRDLCAICVRFVCDLCSVFDALLIFWHPRLICR